MNKVEAHIFTKLEELLTSEVIEERITIFKGDSYWYKHSYRVFTERFATTRGKSTLEAWIERTALIYSWLPRIPLQSFHLKPAELQETIKKLTELESHFWEAELSTIGKTAYLGNEYHGESISPSYKGFYDVGIREFLELGSQLLHGKVNLDTQLSSTTKLLHFMCPQLFPIFDMKICNRIFSSNYQTYTRYTQYVFSLQKYLEEGTEAHLIKKYGNELGVSALYIIDLILFNTQVEAKDKKY